jgi:c-di-GMP-related signal transduction protein
MDIQVARQPIFDRDRRVVAYELLFRSGLENSFGLNSPDTASVQMLDTTLLGFGLDALLGEHSGFFNASRNFMLDGHWGLLPPARAVIEILEIVEPDADIVAACMAAKRAGFRIALDDFVFRPEYEPLLAHADLIKVDFLATEREERVALGRRYADQGIMMLAEKVETHEEFQEALDAGYSLFQGYFFCRPEMVHGKDVGATKSSLAMLICEVNRPEFDFDSVEKIIKHEVALSVKLLRYLRSAGFGWRHEVTTIAQALRILGERATRKWASLVALTMLGDDKPQELVTASLIRAQFCEELGAKLAGGDRSADLFLVGLLSTLDAMLDRPLNTLLDEMSLKDDVTNALRGEDSILSECLALVIAYDRGDWDVVDGLSAKIGVDPATLPGAYSRSVEWVGDLFTSAAASV